MADTVAVVVVAVGIVAGVVVVAAVIVGIAAIVGIAGSVLFFRFLTRFLCFGASALAPGAQAILQKIQQGAGVPGCKFRARKISQFCFSQPPENLLAIIPPCVYYPAESKKWSLAAALSFPPLRLRVSALRSETLSVLETFRKLTCLKH